MIVVSDDDAWWAPLAALCEVRCVPARRVNDALDAVAEVRRGGVLGVVFDLQTGADEAVLALRAMARRQDARRTPPPALAVGDVAPDANAAFEHVESERFGYVGIVDAMASWGSIAPDASPDHDAVEPLDEQGVLRLLRLAREEDYFVLLDARQNADSRTIEALAARLLGRLARARPELGSRLGDEVDEVLEAIEDARAVLTSPRARALYAGSSTGDA